MIIHQPIGHIRFINLLAPSGQTSIFEKGSKFLKKLGAASVEVLQENLILSTEVIM